MADTNQELADIQARVNYELERYGKLLPETADAFRDAKVGVKGFSDAVRTVPKSMADAAGKMAGSMYKGEQGAKAFNSSIDSMAKAADATATVLSALIPGGPMVKLLIAGISKAISAVADVAKKANEQGDSLYKSFQTMSRAGTIGAEGVSGLAEASTKAGYNMLDLSDAIEKINKIAPEVALLGGTAAQGAKRIHEMNAEAYKVGGELEKMGLNAEQQRAAVAGFAKQQVTMGRQMSGQFDSSGEAIKRYIKETDALTRITGQTREQQEAAQERAMANERYAAGLDAMRDEGKKKEADQLVMLNKIMGNLGPTTEKGVQDLIAGMGLNSDEAAKLNQATGGKLMSLIDDVKSGSVKSNKEMAERTEEVMKAMADYRKNIGTTTARLGQQDAMGIKYNELRKAEMMASQKLGDAYGAAEKEISDLAAGTDNLTATQADTAQKQRQAMANEQALMQKAVPAAAAATNQLATAANAASEALLKLANGGKAPTPTQPPTAGTKPLAETEGGAATGARPSMRRRPEHGGMAPPPSQDVKGNLAGIAEAMKARGITDPNYIKATLGNVMKETGGKNTTEMLDYSKTSNDRIRQIFGSRAAGKTDAELDKIKSSQESMGEFMYGSGTKIGQSMGNVEPGDGWKYRGRGYIQLTGKANYAAASKAIFGDDTLVKNPDAVLDPNVASQVVAWYMEKSKSKMQASMGFGDGPLTAEQANLLATSQVAGSDIRKSSDYLKGEVLNKVTANAKNMDEFVPKAKTGGVLSGPDTGFLAELHGTEAVIPLSNGVGQKIADLPDELKDMMNRAQTSFGEKSLAMSNWNNAAQERLAAGSEQVQTDNVELQMPQEVKDLLSAIKPNEVSANTLADFDFGAEIEKIKTDTVDAASPQFDGLLEKFDEMQAELKRQADSTQQLAEALTNSESNRAMQTLLQQVVDQLRQSTDISSKMLRLQH